ncbi:FHA domain-containing protein [Cellulomonas edaphi]|uniref:FHA domain-containing protein n=1 Tax=Cellulomonas edaphi TaxID=3053468 RepID=A0ABT7S7D3_9CELL|nr:FHA domain-containing protein [Cellulomons edaphi]MDM7831543.1 FHA domain-containing protein [Cellulomons edaphi]
MSVPAYRPGTWTAVACPGFVALLDPSVPADTVRAVWERGADGVLGALAVLARQGFEGLPGFALVAVRGQRVHVVQRGDVEVVVWSAVGSRSLTADGVTTWTEQVLEPAVGVELRAGGQESAGEASWPLGDGTARAAQIEVALVPAAAAEGTSAIPVVAPEAPAAAEDPEQGPASEDAGAGRGAAVTTPTPAVPYDVATAPAVPDDVAAAPAPVEDQDDESSARASHDAVPDAVPDDEPDEPDGDVHVPALVPLEAAADEPASGPETGPAHDPVPAQDEPAPTAPQAPIEAPTFTTAATSTSSPSALPALVSVGGSSVDDHDGLTILSTDLAAIRERLPSWAADWTGEAVPGPFGPPKEAGVVPQLVLSTGLVVPLDRAVLLGRAPQVARVTNSELPHLVTVPSPQQDISRTHAEVRVENGQVLVTDLASTNGVHVTRTGEGARRLHPGEATPLESGHVVDLGDGVTFTVERG